MTAVLLGQHDPNTPEWDAIRSRGLGGSEIASVVGLSPWVSRFALFHRKRGTIGKQDVNNGMDWGHRLEPVVLDAFEEQHPGLERLVGTWAHKDRKWQIANPDGLLDGEPVDAKTADKYDAWKWGPSGTDQVPPYYRCQLVHYGDVFGVRAAWIATLIGGNDFRVYRLTWEQDEADWLRNEGEKFWAEVKSGSQPPIDGHDSTYEAVREMHPGIERQVEAELDANLYAEFSATKTTAEDAKFRHMQVKSQLLDQMGDAQFATVNGITVLRRQPARGGSVALYEVKQPIHEEKTA